MTLNSFQARFAFVNTDDGTLTPEAYRTLRDWFTRIGGSNGLTNDEAALLSSFSNDPSTIDVQRQIDDLKLQLASFENALSVITELKKCVQDLEIRCGFVGAPTDWEHPGKIGDKTANTGKFSTVNQVTITTPATAATLTLADNSTLATVGAFTSTFTITGTTSVTFPTTGTLATLTGVEALTNKSYNGNTWTTGTGTLTLGAGKTLASSNTLMLTATDGATLAIGGGGALGTAAYTASGDYAQLAGSSSQAFSVSTLTASSGFGCNGKSAQSAYALGSASTDLATAIALANNLRTMAINNVTGS